MKDINMKFTIIGAGAIGGVIGGYLAKHGNDVTLVDVNSEHINAINRKGLKIETIQGEYVVSVNSMLFDQFIRSSADSDVIILAVKSQHTKYVMHQIKELIGKDSVIVSMQNGLNEHIISDIIGKERTIGSFVNLFADYMGPGEIQYGGVGSLYIGELDGTISNRLLNIQSKLKSWGNALITPNIFGFLWSKLAYGSILTATATVDETMEVLISNYKYRDLFVNIGTEILQVANRLHIKTESFDDWNPSLIYNPNKERNWKLIHTQFDELVKRLQSYQKKKSGIWRDLAVRKRKTEVFEQLDPVIKLGKQYNIHLPLNRKLLSIINELESGRRIMGYHNLNELKAIMN